jgi:hypothetical protein
MAGGGSDALARVDDGVLEQRRPPDGRAHRRAAVLVRGPPARDDAGHGEGGVAAARRHAGAVAGAVRLRIDGRSRAARAVERAQRAAAGIMDEPEVVAAHAVHVRVDDGNGGGGRDGGVDGVAARFEDGEPGFGREDVR